MFKRDIVKILEEFMSRQLLEDDVNMIMVDHEYRLTLLELGLDMDLDLDL